MKNITYDEKLLAGILNFREYLYLNHQHAQIEPDIERKDQTIEKGMYNRLRNKERKKNNSEVE